MTRTLRGVWARRWTLLPLLLLTAVVVAGTVTVTTFAATAGTSRLLVLPLLLVGLVAVPGTARELAAARRGEIALARLRGLQGAELTRVLLAEPLVVLVVGGLLGTAVGSLGGRVAGSVWAGAPGRPGAAALLAGAAVVVVALAATVLGTAGALREPLVQQVSVATRPRPATVLAAFGSVVVVVAAVVATYRSQVSSGDPDWVVLAGPALVGLACGQAAVWVLQLGSRALVPLTSARGIGGFLACRRLARVADAVTAVRVLVAAAVVAALALTGAHQVTTWTDATARLRAGAPLQVVLDTDADGALGLTHRLDPQGRYLMAAVLVPGTGAVPNRRVFLDTARYDAVLGDFYAGTPAARVGAAVDRLRGGDPGLATGTTVTATVQGVSRRTGGLLRPQVVVGYRDDRGRPSQVTLGAQIAPDGAGRSVVAPLPSCARGCVVTDLTLSRHSGDERLPWVLTSLEVGDVEALQLPFQPVPASFPGAPPTGPLLVDSGLMAVPSPGSQTIRTATDGGAAVPILATDTARWTDGPVQLDSPGGDDRPATVLARYAGLPLVERDGVLADLPRAAAGAPPTVPAAVVMVLARADTPAAVLRGLAADRRGRVHTLAQVRDSTYRQARSAQSRMYTLMAVGCLLVALLVLATAVARQRRAWLHDLAALRVVGVDAAGLRGAGRTEVAALVAATVAGTVAGTVLCVRLLLGQLPLVHVPAHAVPLHTGLAVAPLALVAAVAAVTVLVVAGRARTTGDRASRPAVLREEGP